MPSVVRLVRLNDHKQYQYSDIAKKLTVEQLSIPALINTLLDFGYVPEEPIGYIKPANCDSLRVELHDITKGVEGGSIFRVSPIDVNGSLVKVSFIRRYGEVYD